MKKIYTGFIITALVFWTQPIFAVMTGGDYEITIDTFSVVDGSVLSGGDYVSDGTGGEIGANILKTGDYELEGGFWHAEESLNFLLSTSSISLDLTSNTFTTVASSSLILTVSTDSASGYSVAITENSNLISPRNGSYDDIGDVLDGEVTAGSEEYGINTTGGDGLLTTDTAIQNTVIIASKNSAATRSATTINFEAGVATSTFAGSYTQIVTFTASVNP
jgi:hypothetical protein